jgi:hypothetical protein
MYNVNGYHIEKGPSIQEFYDLLKRHDWSFQYSDDHRHWTRGRDELAHIKRVMKQNEDDLRYRSLFDQYRTWAFDTQGDVTKPEKPE